MKKIFRSFLGYFSLCFVVPFSLFKWVPNVLKVLSSYVYTEWKRLSFKHFPSIVNGGGIIYPKVTVIGGKNMMFGKHVQIDKNCVICTWDHYCGEKYKPILSVGNDCGIGERAHISAINKIQIGNGVLIGKAVTIVDNSHGKTDRNLMDTIPINRKLYSKGPVIIEDNVWIGDKTTILPNVIIGKGSLIGANSVISKDIPAYCVAVGNPARIIKNLDHNEK